MTPDPPASADDASTGFLPESDRARSAAVGAPAAGPPPTAEACGDGSDGSAAAPPPSAPADNRAPGHWGISLVFWCTLMLAAACYATVAVSPKLATLLHTRRQYAENAERLAQLESEIDFLEQVSAALSRDPDFARQLAVASLHTGTATTDSAVPERLLAQLPNRRVGQAADEPPSTTERFVQHCASSESTRMALLAIAAVLTVFGFTFLNDSGATRVMSAFAAVGRLLSRLRARYVRPDPVPPQATDADAIPDSGR